MAKVDVLHPSSCLLKGYVQCISPSTTHCSVLTSIPGDPFPLLTEPVSLPHNSPFPEYIVQQHNINGWSYIPIHLYSISTMNHIYEISTCTLSILITEIFTGHENGDTNLELWPQLLFSRSKTPPIKSLLACWIPVLIHKWCGINEEKFHKFFTFSCNTTATKIKYCHCVT